MLKSVHGLANFGSSFGGLPSRCFMALMLLGQLGVHHRNPPTPCV